MNNKSTIRFILGRLIAGSKLYRIYLRKHFSDKDKLNIGCGFNYVENWINIGLFQLHLMPYYVYLLKKKKNETTVIHFDMNQDFPINPTSIKYIYASHFIEHLTFEQGINFTKNSYKVMKKGGKIRLTCPDLETWTKKYYKKDNDFFDKYYNTNKEFNRLPELKTRGEIFMSQLHGWGHKWGYDFESLKDILERAGFSNIEKKQVLDSSLPDIKKLEPTVGMRALETVFVEAEK